MLRVQRRLRFPELIGPRTHEQVRHLSPKRIGPPVGKRPKHMRQQRVRRTGGKLHIVYIHQHFATTDVPYCPRSFDYARLLVSLGHQVTVICGDTFLRDSEVLRSQNGLVKRFTVEGVHVEVVAIPYSNRMGFARRVSSFVAFAAAATVLALRVKGATVVYATSTPLTVGVPALACKVLRGVPYCFEVRDLWPEIPIALGILKNRLLIAVSKLAESVFYRYATRIVGISQGIVDRLARRGIETGRLAVLFSGLDVGLYDAVESDRSKVVEFGLTGRFVAIYAGSVSTVNNLDYVLGVAETLKRDPRIAFLIVGDGRERERLEAEASRRRLSNVVFVGSLPKKQLAALLKASSVGIHSAMALDVFRPVMPNKFFDYLGAGLPVVSNHPAEVNEYIEKLDCGRVFAADSPADMAGFFSWLADNPSEAERMGERSRNAARQLFDRKKLVVELEAILQSVARS